MTSNNFCFFEDEVKKLRQSIAESKSYNDAQRTEAYTAIRSLIPDYAGKGNPLDDKKFVEAIKEKYSKAEPDPFNAFLEAAQGNISYEDKIRTHTYFTEEKSQYQRNSSENSALVHKNLVEWKFLSEKLYETANNLYKEGADFFTFSKGFIFGSLLSTAAAVPVSSAGTTADISEDIKYGSNHPSLEKLSKEINRNKEQLLKELPDQSELIEKMHERLQKRIKNMPRRVNRYQAALEFFEAERVEKTPEKENEKSNYNQNKVSNTINAIKAEINEELVRGVNDDKEKKIVALLLPKDTDLGSMVLADVRARNKEKQKNKSAISGDTSVDFNGVTAPLTCVLPEEFKHQSR